MKLFNFTFEEQSDAECVVLDDVCLKDLFYGLANTPNDFTAFWDILLRILPIGILEVSYS